MQERARRKALRVIVGSLIAAVGVCMTLWGLLVLTVFSLYENNAGPAVAAMVAGVVVVGVSALVFPRRL